LSRQVAAEGETADGEASEQVGEEWATAAAAWLGAQLARMIAHPYTTMPARTLHVRLDARSPNPQCSPGSRNHLCDSALTAVESSNISHSMTDSGRLP
jgi:hypothetical protein